MCVVAVVILCCVLCGVALRCVMLRCPALPCSLAGKDALCAATLLSLSQTAFQRKQLPYVYAKAANEGVGGASESY